MCDEMSPLASGQWGPCMGNGLKCGTWGMFITFDCPNGKVSIHVNTLGQVDVSKGKIDPVGRRRLLGDVRTFIKGTFERLDQGKTPLVKAPLYINGRKILATVVHRIAKSRRLAVVWGLGILLLLLYMSFGAGIFGFGEWRRPDIHVVWVLSLALLLRVLLAPWQIHDLSLYVPQYNAQIATIFKDSTSSWYRLLQSLFVSLAGPSDKAWFLFNALVSGLTIPAFYLVIRNLTESRIVALAASILLTVQPDVIRYAPTDCHHNLLLFNLFWGMALLQSYRVKGLVAGIILLGFAAFLRPEGIVFVLAALLVMDRRLITSIKAHPWVLTSFAFLLLFIPLGLFSETSKVEYFLANWHRHFNWSSFFMTNFATRLLMVVLPLRDTYLPVWRFSLSGLLMRILIGFGLFAAVPTLRSSARRLFMAGLMAAAPVYLLCEPYIAIYAGDNLPAITFMTGVAGIGLYDISRRLKPVSRPLVVLFALLAGVLMISENLGWIRKHLCFQTEYSILVSHRGLFRGHCVLLTWDKQDQDLGLYSYPDLDGCRVMNCYGRSCKIPEPSTMSVFYFRDTSCLIRRAGVFPSKNTPDVRGPVPACAIFERHMVLKPVDVRQVGIDLNRYVIPRSGKIGLFRVTDLRH